MGRDGTVLVDAAPSVEVSNLGRDSITRAWAAVSFLYYQSRCIANATTRQRNGQYIEFAARLTKGLVCWLHPRQPVAQVHAGRGLL